MPSSITRYLDLVDEQREAIFHELGPLPDAVLWHRPGPRVWSIGEHLDHTRVLNCAMRRLLIVYFPLASIFARLFRHRPYEAEIDDVYKRPGFPMNMGLTSPPKYKPRRPVSVGFLLTVGSYSLGSAGGIFAPMLLIGGLLGLGMGEAGCLLGIPWTPDPIVAALIGMAAFFAAVVRCPLTGIVLMVEMTGYYPMVLVLLAASFLAVGIADFFHQEPVYEALMSLCPPTPQDDIELETLPADGKRSPGGRPRPTLVSSQIGAPIGSG